MEINIESLVKERIDDMDLEFVVKEIVSGLITKDVREAINRVVKDECVKMIAALKDAIEDLRKNRIEWIEKNTQLKADGAKYKAFWDQSRLADQMTFEQYEWNAPKVKDIPEDLSWRAKTEEIAALKADRDAILAGRQSVIDFMQAEYEAENSRQAEEIKRLRKALKSILKKGIDLPSVSENSYDEDRPQRAGGAGKGEGDKK